MSVYTHWYVLTCKFIAFTLLLEITWSIHQFTLSISPYLSSCQQSIRHSLCEIFLYVPWMKIGGQNQTIFSSYARSLSDRRQYYHTTSTQYTPLSLSLSLSDSDSLFSSCTRSKQNLWQRISGRQQRDELFKIQQQSAMSYSKSSNRAR